MRTRATILSIATATVLAVAGCGGGGDSEADDRLQKLEDQTAELQQKTEDLQARAQEASENVDDISGKEIEELAQAGEDLQADALALADTAVTELDALEEEGGLSDEQQEEVDQLRQQLETLQSGG